MATKNLASTISTSTNFDATVPLPAGYMQATISAGTVVSTKAIIAIPPALPSRIGVTRLAGNAHIEIQTSVGVWTDIACQVQSARATWGTNKSRGILSQGDAGSLELDIYDPDRLLDPTNIAGPYYEKLLPGLWVRLVYDNSITRIVIKTGFVDSIAHTVSTKAGRITANDWVSLLSNVIYPGVLTTSTPTYSTLHTFAAGVIANGWAGSTVVIPVTVEVEPVTSIPIFPSVGDGSSIWQQITDHALGALQFAWIDSADVMRFRDSTYGHQPGIALGTSGPLPLDFIGAIDADNIYNVISADIGGGISQGIIDAKARQSIYQWGTRKLTSPTLSNFSKYAGYAWSDIVRDDRSQPSFQAVPLRIWPTSVMELSRLVTVEAMQLVVMQFDSVTPTINVTGRLIGEAVEVDSDGWSVEVATWIPR